MSKLETVLAQAVGRLNDETENTMTKLHFKYSQPHVQHTLGERRSAITAQKTKFSIKVFFSKCDQISRKLRIWSPLLKKSLMENFIFVKCIENNFTLHKTNFFSLNIWLYIFLN